MHLCMSTRWDIRISNGEQKLHKFMKVNILRHSMVNQGNQGDRNYKLLFLNHRLKIMICNYDHLITNLLLLFYLFFNIFKFLEKFRTKNSSCDINSLKSICEFRTNQLIQIIISFIKKHCFILISHMMFCTRKTN